MPDKDMRKRKGASSAQQESTSSPSAKQALKAKAQSQGRKITRVAGMSMPFFFLFAALMIVGFAVLGGYLGSRYSTWLHLEQERKGELQRSLLNAARTGALGDIVQLFHQGADLNHRFGDYGTTALIEASASGYLPAVKLILQLGANPNVWNFENVSPLHMVGWCRGTFPNSTKSINMYYHCEPVAAALLEAGHDPNAKRNESFVTPLHLFADHASYEGCKMLLERGADPNAPLSEGSTPLHVVGDLSSKRFKDVKDDLISLFKSHGADFEIRNEIGILPIERPAKRGEVPAERSASLGGSQAQPDSQTRH